MILTIHHTFHTAIHFHPTYKKTYLFNTSSHILRGSGEDINWLSFFKLKQLTRCDGLLYIFRVSCMDLIQSIVFAIAYKPQFIVLVYCWMLIISIVFPPPPTCCHTHECNQDHSLSWRHTHKVHCISKFVHCLTLLGKTGVRYLTVDIEVHECGDRVGRSESV